jgi:y4mF family transcriptional regulator
MALPAKNIPSGNSGFDPAVVVRTSAQLGSAVRERRKTLALKQEDVAGLGGTGNRFIVDLEGGKPTMQIQKVMDILDLLGLELTVRPKVGRAA